MRRIAKLSLLMAPLLMASVSGCATSSWMGGSASTDPREARINRLMSVAAEYESQGKHDSAMRVYEHVLAQQPEHNGAMQRRELLAQQGIKGGGRPLKSEPSTAARELYASASRSRSVVPLGSQNNSAEDTVATIHRKNAELAQLLASKKTSTHPLVVIPSDQNQFDNGLEPTPVAERSLIAESKASLTDMIQSVSGNVEDSGWVPTGTSNTWTLVSKDSAPAAAQADSEDEFKAFIESPSSQEAMVAAATPEAPASPDGWTATVPKADVEPKTVAAVEDGWMSTATAKSTADSSPMDQSPMDQTIATVDTSDANSPVELASTSTATSSQDAWQTADLTRETPASEFPSSESTVTAQNWAATRHLNLVELCGELPAHVRPLVEKLENVDPVKRIEGLLELGELKSEAESAGVAVYALMEDTDPVVAIYAAGTLRQITGDSWSSVHTLISYLDHPEPGIAQLSAYLLGQMGPEAMEAVPALEKIRSTGDSLTALHAAEALTHIAPADSASVAKLTEALKSGDREVRWFAAVSLGSVTGACETQAAQALKDALQDGETEVQVAACLSLGGLGANAAIAIPELEKASQSNVEDVKSAAETALACLRG